MGKGEGHGIAVILVNCIGYFSLFCGLEIKSNRIDTVAKSCWLWPVQKEMSKVGIASEAENFRSHHPVRAVLPSLNA